MCTVEGNGGALLILTIMKSQLLFSFDLGIALFNKNNDKKIR